MTPRGDRYRVGVDIGGTFTDFVLVDGETGPRAPPQVPDHAQGPVGGRPRGAGGTPAGGRPRLRRPRHPRSRHHARDQRHHRADRQLAGPPDHARVPGRRRDGDRAALRHLRPVPALPGAARPACLPPRGRRAARPRRACGGAARSRPGPRGGGRPRPGRRRGPRRLLPPRVPQPGPRAPRGRDGPARVPWPGGVAVLRGRARAPRVRAERNHRGQRVRSAPHGPVRRQARGRAGRARLRRPVLPHPVVRRHDLASDRATVPDPSPGVGAGRRRAGHRLLRAAGRAGRRHRLRHGRDHRQGLPRPGRPARRGPRHGGCARPPLQARQRASRQGARDRHDRDRGGRRVDRPRRRPGPPQGRTAKRGRRSRASLLRARRQGADRHRRESAPGLSRSRVLPRRAHAARAAASRGGGRRARRTGRPRPYPDGVGRLRDRVREHGGSGPGAHRREGPGPPAVRDGGLRRRGAGARGARGPDPRHR